MNSKCNVCGSPLNWKITSGDQKLSELNLSNRARNALHMAGFKFIKELLELPAKELYRMPNLGKKSVSQIIRLVELNGLSFKDAIPEPWDKHPEKWQQYNELQNKMRIIAFDVYGEPMTRNEEWNMILACRKKMRNPGE
mgnify:CR=1 FL=1